MDITVGKSQIAGEITAPPSKSVAHRVMIAAALAGVDFVQGGGEDVKATARCLCALKPYITAHKSGKECNEHITLNVGESGSTLRFLLPVAAALGANCTFIGEGRLAKRPLADLIETLTLHGAKISTPIGESLPLELCGKLSGDEFEISGSVSSQYITGMLFALSLLGNDCKLKVKGELVSAAYVDITLSVLKDFGIEIEKCGGGYALKNSPYVCKNLSVEGDWSSAAFLVGMGLLCGEVRVKGLNFSSAQGDKIIVELLKKAGGNIETEGDTLIAKKSNLFGIEVNVDGCPDTAPALAAILSHASGRTVMTGVERLKTKESDRLFEIMNMLGCYGILCRYENGALIIEGGGHKQVSEFAPQTDHRIAMSSILLALANGYEGKILNVECIDKSYPNFIADAKSLGAKIE